MSLGRNHVTPRRPSVIELISQLISIWGENTRCPRPGQPIEPVLAVTRVLVVWRRKDSSSTSPKQVHDVVSSGGGRDEIAPWLSHMKYAFQIIQRQSQDRSMTLCHLVQGGATEPPLCPRFIPNTTCLPKNKNCPMVIPPTIHLFNNANCPLVIPSATHLPDNSPTIRLLSNSKCPPVIPSSIRLPNNTNTMTVL